MVEYTDGGKPNVEAAAGYVSWSPKGVFEKAYTVSAQPRQTTYLGTADGRNLGTARTLGEVAPVPHDARVRSPCGSEQAALQEELLGCLDLQKHTFAKVKRPNRSDAIGLPRKIAIKSFTVTD